jgi:myo-inositol 2-dehydrogenase/D-chiro-inositol 1-dehydrogenase
VTDAEAAGAALAPTPARARLRVGQVGLGGLGATHARNLGGRIPGAELVRVVDLDAGRAEGLAAELATEWATDYEALLEDPQVEAVVIATPTSLHAEMIERAARAGKHVFTEKPPALTRESALPALAAARAAGIALQVGFQRRFDPDWREAKRRIDRGELGRPYLFRSSLRDAAADADADFRGGFGTLLMDASIHDLDTARWLVGEVDEVTALGASLSSPAYAEADDMDNAAVLLRFESGALGLVDASRVAGYGFESSTELVGSKATARIGDGRATRLDWLTPGRIAADHVADFVERHAEAYRLELEAFVERVRRGEPVEPTGADGLAALVLALAAERSVREARRVRLSRTGAGDHLDYTIEETSS